MRYGLSIPPFGPFGDPHVLVELACAAERGGWDGVFLWDHIKAGDWAGPLVDPWVTLAAIAAATERILLGPMVTPLPRRRPAKLARETVTLDHLSGGRLILGVGTGWPSQEDFADFGDPIDVATRAALLDEALEVLTALWSGEAITHRGEHYTAVGTFLPTPRQHPRIPIWVGGMWPHRGAFRRAARWDGVFPIEVDTAGEIVEITPDTLAEIVAFVRANRTDDAPFEVASYGWYSDSGDRTHTAAAYAQAGATWWMESIGWPPDRTIGDWRDLILAGPPG
jgi:alkanesulfonate monooxygenase SsuD/methylene tetrahydromethanopterin reductase-like flavin-dependent oxidoreductase (luciferase family)